LLLLFAGTEQLFCEQWYRSNAAGMVLEYMPSKIVALRNVYALGAAFIDPEELPDHLQPYFKPYYKAELHILYENGAESRRQWICKDAENVTRLVSAAGNSASSSIPQTEADSIDENPGILPFTGFIEVYNERGFITEDRQFYPDGSERAIAYVYKGDLLVRADVQRKTSSEEGESAESISDKYRYSRSKALRSITRTYTEDKVTQSKFPYLGSNTWKEELFITPVTPYTSAFMQDAADAAPQDEVGYMTDERGKLLAETRRDAEGTVRGELRNTWDGDRLKSIDWKADGDERRTEYEYDNAGNRILERNYKQGVLERIVRREDELEIEELYINGEVILRAVWEKGRKIKEERIRASKTGGK
jgi:hypothetical protein